MSGTPDKDLIRRQLRHAWGQVNWAAYEIERAELRTEDQLRDLADAAVDAFAEVEDSAELILVTFSAIRRLQEIWGEGE